MHSSSQSLPIKQAASVVAPSPIHPAPAHPSAGFPLTRAEYGILQALVAPDGAPLGACRLCQLSCSSDECTTNQAWIPPAGRRARCIPDHFPQSPPIHSLFFFFVHSPSSALTISPFLLRIPPTSRPSLGCPFRVRSHFLSLRFSTSCFICLSRLLVPFPGPPDTTSAQRPLLARLRTRSRFSQLSQATLPRSKTTTTAEKKHTKNTKIQGEDHESLGVFAHYKRLFLTAVALRTSTELATSAVTE
ncbi:hypothetical protein M441DRAFT_435562 [Trichoderma asperellum CBS 433.97]|uniref:Uncharacterized protein n=1 Tax=Trichoderma asperellum (strain ATCC 204424 / CBS 433.97 / NBRC 101777) TaxID=1042311 RepID=A0A2T3Z3G9_TRIA4|nr:hypothetical protein M441DRAFT_435562 [Trichoderma asperellum CBS 433.97]PTB39300.1 hypothetical protein M441DRAFT_435562 [Trichoderma asperellum CBS 433.97]